MSKLRLIKTESQGDKVAKVYRDSEWNEYRVVYLLNGSKLNNADYHTSDKVDALDTAANWVK